MWLLPAALLVLPACTRDAPTPPASTQRAARPPADAKTLAHADLAHRLRRFLITRTTPGLARGPMAADDERVRLGAFWRARTDTHHFGADFQSRAERALAAAGSAPAADAALRRLRDTVEARLPAWQALVDYNAAGTMRDDGGAEGRRLLPWAIASIDAIEAATWGYLDAVDAQARGRR
ncbi:conserved hypothetical protein [Luteimonas sp. 9C]|uniref:hypothetical protein n=1 Tax=Luteimonas sp. 9C TaxID=2653148 RepID=UPI0012F278B0|nr:hypothetical protein [Luteimonas sp. 9C]VXB79125.1 conserved hypothetical protein [Luteimonas sp. 9C]